LINFWVIERFIIMMNRFLKRTIFINKTLFLALSKNQFKQTKYLFFTIAFSFLHFTHSQENKSITGLITHQNTAIDKASIEIIGTDYTNQTDSLGSHIFRNVPQGNYKIEVSAVGLKTQRKSISIQKAKQIQLNFELQTEDNELNEVVVWGTLKAIKRLECDVLVEIYSPVFFFLIELPVFKKFYKTKMEYDLS
jgi:hypothetical protein